jgi:hypothetical protein
LKVPHNVPIRRHLALLEDNGHRRVFGCGVLAPWKPFIARWIYPVGVQHERMQRRVSGRRTDRVGQGLSRTL